ncbi:hypothetical protein BON30_17205 [Cystobacter ferrugineus]|uniref:Uncharacterized protein n=1 Tax=Cystobacter ferrugineus TaxID=83449 RepID=A0A1L9BAJ6_9BACT|nr:hypothetical protein BON30_17205 [Cystobacter ferrugineus]
MSKAHAPTASRTMAFLPATNTPRMTFQRLAKKPTFTSLAAPTPTSTESARPYSAILAVPSWRFS